MSSRFVVVGPADDPASVDDTDDVVEAFRSIADTGATFVSRGDESGTHVREREIWMAAGREPGGEWYHDAGTGMGNTLVQADELDGYSLAVRGTVLSMGSELNLGIRLEPAATDVPALLSNPYGIAAVNPARHEHVTYDLAMTFIGFLTSPDGQAMIAEQTVDGEQLFVPRALSTAPNFHQYVPDGWTPEQRDE